MSNGQTDSPTMDYQQCVGGVGGGVGGMGWGVVIGIAPLWFELLNKHTT